MEAGSALGPTPLRGFKDFYQYAATTRVIAGRDLLSSTGFEFQKEGARRVFVVTDEVIRGTGLVDRIEAGLADLGCPKVSVSVGEEREAGRAFWQARGYAMSPARQFGKELEPT